MQEKSIEEEIASAVKYLRKTYSPSLYLPLRL